MNQLLGLPAHPLFAHLTVVAIPVAALLAAIVAVFPRVPRLVKIVTLVLCGLSVILVPLMMSSGESLEERVSETAAVERHTQMGESLLPWVIGLLVAIVAVLAVDWWRRRSASGDPGRQTVPRRFIASGRILTIAVAVVAVVVATGTLVQTVRIGHSGALATWSSPGVTPIPEVNRGDQDDG